MDPTQPSDSENRFISKWLQSSVFLIVALGGGAILGACCGGALAAYMGASLLMKAGGCFAGSAIGGGLVGSVTYFVQDKLQNKEEAKRKKQL